MDPKVQHYANTRAAMFDAVKISLGMTEDEANAFFRYSQPHGESHSITPITPDDERCYARISSTPLTGVGVRERQYRSGSTPETAEKTVTMTDAVNLTLNFYGPSAVTNAERVLAGIFEDEARVRLANDNLAPVNAGTMPVWIPELINGVWYNRCDLEIRMYRVVEYGAVVEAIIESPEIVIRRER